MSGFGGKPVFQVFDKEGEFFHGAKVQIRDLKFLYLDE
jgi:hypothetical protein